MKKRYEETRKKEQPDSQKVSRQRKEKERRKELTRIK